MKKFNMKSVRGLGGQFDLWIPPHEIYQALIAWRESIEEFKTAVAIVDFIYRGCQGYIDRPFPVTREELCDELNFHSEIFEQHENSWRKDGLFTIDFLGIQSYGVLGQQFDSIRSKYMDDCPY